MADSVFNEILGIEMDVQAFSNSLDALIKVYDSKLEELNSRGITPDAIISQNTFAQLNTELGELRTSILSVIGSFIDGFAQVGAQVSEVSQQVASSSSSFRKVGEALDTVASPAERVKEALLGIADAAQDQTRVSTLSFQEQGQVFASVQGMIQARGVEVLEGLTAANLKWYEGYAATLAKAELNLVEFTEAQVLSETEALQEMEALHTQALIDDEAWTRKRIALIEQAQRQMPQGEKLSLDEINELHAQALVADEAWTRKRIALIGQASKENVAREKISMDDINALHAEALLADEAWTRKRIALIEQAQTANQKFNKESQGLFSQIFSGITEDFSSSIASVTRFYVLWGLVGEAMHIVQGIGEAIVGVFTNGADYLNKVQEKATELTGILDANVKFSDNLAENFRKSGEEAENIVKTLQRISIKDNLNPDQLTASFKALTEGGGANFVTQLDQMVQLAELFSLAMKASGKDVQVTRSLISDIPKLLDGSIDKESKILEVLHLTKAEWEQIRQAGLEHHDLLERLEGTMQPYLAAVESAQTHQSVLTESLKLMRDQIEAAIAKPLWEEWTALLQQAKGFLDENKDSLVAIGNSVVLLVQNTGKLVGALGDLTGIASLLKDAFSLIGVVLAGVAAGLNIILSSATFVAKSLYTLLSTALDPSKVLDKEAWKKAFDDITDYAQEASTANQKATNDLYTSITGQSTELGGQTGPVKISAKNPPPPPGENDSALNKLKNEFAEQLRAYQANGKEVRQEIKEQVETRVIDAKEGYDRIAKSYTDEGKLIDDLIAKYRDLAEAQRGKAKTRSIDNFESTLTKDSSSAAAQAKDGASQARIAGYKTELKADEDALKAKEKAASDEAKAEIALNKDKAQQGIILNEEAVLRELDANERLHNELVALYEQEKTLAGNNAEAIAAADNKIAAEKQRFAAAEKKGIEDIGNARAKDLQQALRIDQEHQQASVNSLKAQIQAEKERGATAGQMKQYLAALAQAELDLIIAQQAETQAALEDLGGMQAQGKEADTLRAKLEALAAARIQAAQTAKTKQDETTLGGTASQAAFGVPSLKDAFGDFGKSVDSLQHGFDTFKNAAQNIVQGFSQGGVTGGLGAIASTAANFLPGIAGQVAGLVGSVLSTISSLFTAAARHMAEQIKKEVDKITTAYSQGQATLVATIQQLEQERQKAISELSGKKGGKDELDKLLPQIDQQLADLKAQQKQTIDNFEQQLAQLNLHSDALSGLLKTWTDINKQVKDYIGAGGSAAKAAQFLSLQLQQQKEQAKDQLDQGEQDAINDALHLNDLLKQRNDLEKQYAQTVFQLKTADAIERRGSNAISVGNQLADKKADFDAQLAQINSDIQLTGQKLTIEKQIYSIASDTAALQARSNALQLAALNEQISKLKDLQKIYNGIYQKPDGSYGLSSTLQGILNGSSGTSVGDVHITVTSPGPVNGKQLADEFSKELNRRVRQGLTPARLSGY